MIIHDLKCWPSSFLPIVAGYKKAEFRLGDRDYKRNDFLLLREWMPADNPDELEASDWVLTPGYTGNVQLVQVTHVLHGPAFGVPDGYVMLSFNLMQVTVAP